MSRRGADRRRGRTARILARGMVLGSCLLSLVVPAAAHAPSHSRLWGAQGESYRPTGWLPDFAWAGFRGGEGLPHPKPVASVRDFGARGDGKSDDTAAFQRALDAATGAILIPRGRYRLAGQLSIARSGVILRGEGSGEDGTVLQFQDSLADLQHRAELPPRNELSWTGGLIQISPEGRERGLTQVVVGASRGERRLRVSDAHAIHAGDVLVLRLSEDRERSLERYMVSGVATSTRAAGQAPPPSTCAARVLDWTFEVAAVDGNTLVLSQPLRTDVRMDWSPAIRQEAMVHDVGIEHLTIQFPSTPYPGHHRERGFNAIDLDHNVVNAFVSDVTIVNCDSGVFVGHRSKWVTIRGLRFLSSRPGDAHGNQGHHGIALSGCSDVLVTDVTFDAELIHELTLDHRAMGNVFAGPVRARTLDLDHHRDAPYENLFTDLAGPVHLQRSGRDCYGPPSGARNTYWGLDAFPLPDWLGQRSVVVGALAPGAREQHGPAQWIESAAGIEPRSLYLAQRRFRLAAKELPQPTRTLDAGPSR